MAGAAGIKHKSTSSPPGIITQRDAHTRGMRPRKGSQQSVQYPTKDREHQAISLKSRELFQHTLNICVNLSYGVSVFSFWP